MKNNNKILYISIAILVLAFGILIGTYAYYQTTISGTISGNVAKWSFKANGQTSSFNLDLGDLYPGASGTYNIELSAEDSELDVYYEMYATSLNFLMTDGYITLNQRNDERWISNNSQCGYAGFYGTIAAGSKVNIPVYLNWPYDGDDYEEDADGSFIDFKIEVIGKQLTGYEGSLPLYLMPTDLDTNYADGYIYMMCGAPV